MPEKFTEALSPAQIDVGKVKLAVGIAKISIVLLSTAVVPICVTLTLTVRVPAEFQLSVYGPTPEPDTMVAPSKFHETTAPGRSVPVKLTATCSPAHALAGMVNEITGVFNTSVCVLADASPQINPLTVHEIVFIPALDQLTKYGPAPEPERTVPPAKFQV